MEEKKKCPNKVDGNCPLHNIQCQFPTCEIQEGVEYKLYEKVLTDYYENEVFTIVGIREKELELQGDWSGGTNNVCQRSWYPANRCTKITNN